MELNQIKYVVNVAECKSFSKAAAKLSVSQPTLTQQIGKLEAELGVLLFNRTTRTISLTEAGMDFVTYAIHILEDFDVLKDAMKKHAVLNDGSLHIGIMPDASLFGLTACLSKYATSYSNVHIAINQASSRELASELLGNKLDVAFIDHHELENWVVSSLDLHFLKKEPIYLALPKNDRLSDSASITISDIKGQDILRYKCSEAFDSAVLRSFARAGIPYQAKRDYFSLRQLYKEIAGGHGISFIPASLCNTSEEGICFREVVPQIYSSLAIATSKNQKTTKVVHDFIKYISANMSKKEKAHEHS